MKHATFLSLFVPSSHKLQLQFHETNVKLGFHKQTNKWGWKYDFTWKWKGKRKESEKYGKKNVLCVVERESGE